MKALLAAHPDGAKEKNNVRGRGRSFPALPLPLSTSTAVAQHASRAPFSLSVTLPTLLAPQRAAYRRPPPPCAVWENTRSVSL